MKLNNAQLQFFREQGYLVVDDIYANSDFQPVIDEINSDITRRARDLIASSPKIYSYHGLYLQDIY